MSIYTTDKAQQAVKIIEQILKENKARFDKLNIRVKAKPTSYDHILI